MTYLMALDNKNRSQYVDWVVKHIRKNKDENKAIACTGLSGLLVSAPVAQKLNMPLLVVRKSGEKSHGLRVEYFFSVNKKTSYIIIDDFSCSGATIKRIYKQINKCEWLRYHELSRVYLYKKHDYHCSSIDITRKVQVPVIANLYN